jgi:hypothetical protein
LLIPAQVLHPQTSSSPLNASLPNLEIGLQIGDYVLSSRLETFPDRQVWLGKQVSVKRKVEIVCYYGPDPESFLADIRVKARVEDGVLGLVYEAIPTKEFIACAREVLPRKSLATIAEDDLPLLPVEITRIISQIATTLKTLDKRGIARNNFDGSDIRLGLDNAVRMHNIAKDGPRIDDADSRRALAEVLRKLLKIGQPGATRMGTLLDYIEGTETQPAISWSQTEKLARQVDDQLSMANIPVRHAAPVMESRKSYQGTMIAGLICGLIALIIGFFVFRGGGSEFETDLVITVPGGRYPHPDGGVESIDSFRIDAAEVTIREYAEFMVAWQGMTRAQQQRFWPANKPEDKTNVRPEEWNTYFPLARAKGVYNGLDIGLDYPVIGVDWWDARTYANWKKGRLPNEEEWWAASSSLESASKQSNTWRPVGGLEKKIYGLDGNVSEWAGEFSKNPAFPIDSPKAVILGSSFRKPSKDALNREWVDDPNTRRDDLGFRVVYDVE